MAIIARKIQQSTILYKIFWEKLVKPNKESKTEKLRYLFLGIF